MKIIYTLDIDEVIPERVLEFAGRCVISFIKNHGSDPIQYSSDRYLTDVSWTKTGNVSAKITPRFKLKVTAR